MSAGAVQKYGVDTLESMNAAGGGNNKPKVVHGTTYAAGGGMVGDSPPKNGQTPLTPEQISKLAHATTVRIMSSAAAPGSGVLVKNDNGLYTALTAGHVLGNIQLGQDEIEIVTPDGKSHNIKPNKTNYKDLRSKGVDLGMIQFKSKNNYSVAKIGKNQTDKVFVGGFPNIPMSDDMTNMVMRLQEGQINSPEFINKKSKEAGYDIGYNAPTIGGMSGGALLNAFGELIGIHGSGQTDDEKTKDIKESGAAAIDYNKHLRDLGLENIGNTTSVNPPVTNFLINLLSSEKLKAEDKVLGEGIGHPSLINYKGLSRKFFDQYQQWELPTQTQPNQSSLVAPAKISSSSPRLKSITPPSRPDVKVTYIPASGANRSENVRGGGASSTKTPSFSATTNGMRSKQETLGLMR